MSDEQNPVTILVVDDTPDNLHLVTALLKDQYKVRVATSGQQALRLMAIPPCPDLVLLDVMMPVMDGHEVCKRLKANPETASVPVIFLTSRGEREDEEVGFALGAVDYITRPITPALLKARVRTHLELKASRDRLTSDNRWLEQEVRRRTEQVLVLYQEQQSLLEAVERFVPERLVRMAGAVDVRRVQAGQQHRGSKWVVFADLRGFTALSEKLTPVEVHATLQEFFGAVVPIVERHNGVVDKFLGDGFMGLFPGDGPPPLRACHEMAQALEGLNEARHARGVDPLVLSLALHGGPVLLCVLGDAQRIEITAVSDIVNVTSRLESMTRTVGCSIIASDEVHDALPPEQQALLRPLGKVRVRGRVATIGIHDASLGAGGEGQATRDDMLALLSSVQSADPRGHEMALRLRERFPRDAALAFFIASLLEGGPSSLH